MPKKAKEKTPETQTPGTPKKGPATTVLSVKEKKKAMLAALEKTLGIVKTACDLAGVNRQAHYKWMGKDIKYAQAVQDITELAIDFVESKLHNLINKGDTAATIFYMKTKAKQRGYIERQELTGPGGSPLVPEKRQVMVINGKEIEF